MPEMIVEFEPELRAVAEDYGIGSTEFEPIAVVIHEHGVDHTPELKLYSYCNLLCLNT